MGQAVLTRDGFDKLQEELKYLKTKKRKEVTEALATARAHGDLKENAEYDAAKEAKAHLETRIAKIELTLSNAKIVDPSELPQGKAFLGTTLEVKNLKTNATFKYTLVGPDEADLAAGKISTTSPIGKGLLGKDEGDEVEVDVPAGKVKLKIVKITIGD